MTEVESALDERMDELTERMARVEGIRVRLFFVDGFFAYL